MIKLSLVFLLLTLFSLKIFSQEKKLLLRYDEISKSELDIKNQKYIKKGKTKSLGTILVYSKKVIFYGEENETFETYDINEISEENNGERTLYISKSGKKYYVFALTKDKTYFSQIGKKDRFIYRIINYKSAEEE
ncbi:hypothetical protein UMM65_12735 [Aureibaculum sp. 2210JD6-5]|uniref:hypothetical protein n=1 Tax=Aureibaculum sp. 2210JD6-5 TaxID=3103957 RepID=UPI002AAC633C|nr:hypothetical protein [Aureibaculum sp. 2210JD6-5]MDY7396109.1 hypothetical protein [Aureibaculum sp. 2210JD6-5]